MKARKWKPVSATKRPVHVFYDTVADKFWAGQYYHVTGDGQALVVGTKFDVTQDIRHAFTVADPFGMKAKMLLIKQAENEHAAPQEPASP